MWKFAGSVEFSCVSCDEKNGAPIDVFDCEITTKERGLGVEYIHSLSFIGECEGCRRQYQVEYDVFEFPLGCLNRIETNHEGIKGCNFPETEYFHQAYSVNLRDCFQDERKSSLLKDVVERVSKLDNFEQEWRFELRLKHILEKVGFPVFFQTRTKDNKELITGFASGRVGETRRVFLECKQMRQAEPLMVRLVESIHIVHNAKERHGNVIIAVFPESGEFESGFDYTGRVATRKLSPNNFNEIIQWL